MQREPIVVLAVRVAEIGVDKRASGPYNLSGCERVRAELFTINDKACLTIDKNGIIFDPLDPDDFQRAFQCAFSRFHSAGVRKNLMPLSFEDYVSAYIDIDG